MLASWYAAGMEMEHNAEDPNWYFADLMLTCAVCGGFGNDHTQECLDAEAAYWGEGE